MKRLLILVAIAIFCLPLNAQDETITSLGDSNYNFRMIDGNVTWQYVYKTDRTSSEIVSYFKSAQIFTINNVSDSVIYGSVDRKPIEYSKYGFSTGLVPMYIIGAPCSYSVIIEMKENKYRVSISNVVFGPAIRLGMYVNNVQMTLNDASYNYKRGKFKDAFIGQNAAEVLATVWYGTYILKAPVTSNRDW